MLVFPHCDLSSWHSMAARASARELRVLEKREELASLHGDDILLGRGSNTIFVGELQRRVVCVRLQEMSCIKEDNNTLWLQVDAGVPWADVVRFALEHDLGGVENLIDIPASAGAAVVQNIGAYGVEISALVDSVEVYCRNSTSFMRLSAKDCAFAYRHSVFKQDKARDWLLVSVVLRLHKKYRLCLDYKGLSEIKEQLHCAADVADRVRALRREKLPSPDVLPNSGSFFHNPLLSRKQADALAARFQGMPVFASRGGIKLSAAWCIERAGLKGVRDGQMGVYAKHALIVVNYGGASGEEVLRFAAVIQEQVASVIGVSLTMEPVVFRDERYG